MTRVVVAPDKFKGSLTAVAAAEAIAAGVRDALPYAEILSCPVADGGEGTLEVLEAAGAHIVAAHVRGPLDDMVDARYAMLHGTAYIESARACGIEFVFPAPSTALAAHTWGVGELIAHALARGSDRIVLTVGGTASTDGGAGMLGALGAGVWDAFGSPVGLGGGTLHRVASVEMGPVHDRIGETPVVVATDVTNPLLGPEGAAAVFGPQKGAGPTEIAQLEEGLRRWAHALGPHVAYVPGAGAGGGLAAGAIAGLGATVESGFALIADLTGIDSAISGADLVITGEGSLDAQSLNGKAPAGIAARTRRRGIPLLVLAGRITLDDTQLEQLGVVAASALIDYAPSLDHARTHAAELLRAQAASLVQAWLP